MTAKKSKVPLPEIPWSENDHTQAQSLVVEISKPINYKVLYDKKDKIENTSGGSKASVYKHIGAMVLPEFHALHVTGTGDQIKSKLEIYKCHAVKLHTTRNGIQKDGDVDGSDSEKFCNFYIGVDGSNEGTSLEAKNIWNQIIKQFPFFSELHRIFVACPNITPIAMTTEVGPQGKKTLHLQPLDEPQIEFSSSQVSQIQTLQDALNYVQAQTSADMARDDTRDLSQTLSEKDPRVSSLSWKSFSKAKEHVQKVLKKHTIEDTLFEIQKYSLCLCS
ncbi:hypothetical protein ID866_8784 [Astraeus odoratus]|nr:hypothetical protein ID866_8784 [Astraeus odoratus]